MSLPANLDQLSADQLRQLVIRQAAVLADNDRELTWRQGKIDKLTHELAMHKRWRFGVKTEHWPTEQAQLFAETVDADLAAMEAELAQLSPTPSKTKGQAKRQPLPANLPRTEIRHEPASTVCTCGCMRIPIVRDRSVQFDVITSSDSY